MSDILIGTSGWSYDSWRGRFYPKSLPTDEWLSFYASHFPTVEVNNSFYRLPTPKTYRTWAKRVPNSFKFAVKASKFLTHNKKLATPQDPWKRMMTTTKNLVNHLGPLLLQFPPIWQKNVERLREFLEFKENQRLFPKIPLVFEFRNKSWLCEEVYELLREHNVALCIADSPALPRSDVITTSFTYFRFHGRDGADAPNYSRARLKAEANKIKGLQSDGIIVYVYFNNDTNACAVRNAATLADLLA